MTSEPLISIVTVCLNSAEYIERCINSVLDQTYTNIEYIIIDGGSTDATVEIIKKYEHRITRWVSEKDGGIYDAMNKGIELCKGEFIGLLNSDDYYLPDAIQKVVDTISNDQTIDVLHGDMIGLNQQDTIVSRGNHDNLINNWAVKHPACFISSNVYQTCKYDETMKISADYDLLLKLWVAGRHFKHIDQVLTCFSPFGISSKPSWAAVRERYRIRAKYDIKAALHALIKEAALHCDELFHSSSVSNRTRQKKIYRLYASIKSVCRPAFLLLKKFMLNQ